MSTAHVVTREPGISFEDNLLMHGQPGVLVVDDEEMIRAVLGLFLHQRGISHWLTGSGQEAAEVYAKHADETGLVLLDVKMPGLDGMKTLARLQERNPAVVCYFMSGSWAPYAEADLLKQGATAVLAKPFRFKQIDEILDKHIFQVA